MKRCKNGHDLDAPGAMTKPTQDHSLGRCRACKNARDRARYAANPEAHRSRSLAYRVANPEAERARSRAYRAANLEAVRACVRACTRAWRKTEKGRASSLRSHGKNRFLYQSDRLWREKRSAYALAYRAKTREAARARDRAWRAKQRALYGPSKSMQFWCRQAANSIEPR